MTHDELNQKIKDLSFHLMGLKGLADLMLQHYCETGDNTLVGSLTLLQQTTERLLIESELIDVNELTNS